MPCAWRYRDASRNEASFDSEDIPWKFVTKTSVMMNSEDNDNKTRAHCHIITKQHVHQHHQELSSSPEDHTRDRSLHPSMMTIFSTLLLMYPGCTRVGLVMFQSCETFCHQVWRVTSLELHTTHCRKKCYAPARITRTRHRRTSCLWVPSSLQRHL